MYCHLVVYVGLNSVRRVQLFSMIKSEDGIKRRGDFFWSVVDFSFEKDTIGHIFTGQYYGLQLHHYSIYYLSYIMYSMCMCLIYKIYSRHNIAELLLKLALNTNQSMYMCTRVSIFPLFLRFLC